MNDRGFRIPGEFEDRRINFQSYNLLKLKFSLFFFHLIMLKVSCWWSSMEKFDIYGIPIKISLVGLVRWNKSTSKRFDEQSVWRRALRTRSLKDQFYEENSVHALLSYFYFLNLKRWTNVRITSVRKNDF